MTKQEKVKALAIRRKTKVRSKLFGTLARPRLSVHRSNKYTYLQVINDETGKTLATASELTARKRGAAVSGTKTVRATQIAAVLSGQLKKKKITALCFDRGQ